MGFVFFYLPPVTLENDTIKISGRYGGLFKVSDIQSVDTISVLPKVVGMMRGGSIIHYGFYELQHEKMASKLRVYNKYPPYIKVRMNNNSLVMFNFKESDKTVEFYNQLKNIIYSN